MLVQSFGPVGLLALSRLVPRGSGFSQFRGFILEPSFGV